MAFNPSTEVQDARDLARKWGSEQVIIIAINSRGDIKMATYGSTKLRCKCAKVLGDTAFDAITERIQKAEPSS